MLKFNLIFVLIFFLFGCNSPNNKAIEYLKKDEINLIPKPIEFLIEDGNFKWDINTKIYS